MRTHLWIVLALLATMAGCLGGNTDAADTAPTADEETTDPVGTQAAPTEEASGNASQPLVAEVPVWEVGDWWTYRVDGTDGAEEITFAVAEKNGESYQLLTDGREHTVFDAAFTELPYLGPIRVEDLSGTQAGDRVRLFAWPLEEGASWTTTWNFARRTVEAQAASVPVPDGETRGFELTATSGGDTFATYTYAPDVGWFTKLELPQLAISYELVDHGTGYEESLLFGDAQQVYEAPEAPADAARFAVPEAADVVALEAGGGGPTHAQAVRLLAPDGTVHETSTEPCRDCFAVHRVQAPAQEGEWTIAHVAAEGPGPVGGFSWADASTVTLHEIDPPHGGVR